MPKPTRRERRMLAEKGKLAPRRVIPNVGTPTTNVVSSSQRSSAAAAAKQAAADSIVNPHEYDYVKADLLRIVTLAAALIAVMIGLKFALPQ